MSRSFDRLIEFFSLEQREKEGKVEDIFQETLEFLKYFKHIQNEGTEEEKKSVQEKLSLLQARFKQEAETTISDLKLSSTEVTDIVSQKKNFSDDQWTFLENVRSVFNEQKEAFKQAKDRSGGLDKLRKTKRKNIGLKSKKWLKS